MKNRQKSGRAMYALQRIFLVISHLHTSSIAYVINVSALKGINVSNPLNRVIIPVKIRANCDPSTVG